MSLCTFTVSFTCSTEELLNKTRSSFEKQGGTFKGDETSGDFHISVMGYTVVGAYAVLGNMLEVIIDEKPMLIPCSVIESYLQAQINK